jgi:hypothetical protein
LAGGLALTIFLPDFSPTSVKAQRPTTSPVGAPYRLQRFWHRFFFRPFGSTAFSFIPNHCLMRRLLLKPWLLLSLAATLGGTAACSSDGDGVLLFSVEDDKTLGQQVAAKTDSTYRAQGKLLERNGTNARAYQLLDGVVNKVLNSGEVRYRTEFPWDVKIIKDDAVQNAFATPGGHIYVFSGLIKFLDDENQLAGVLGHEIAHADRRHTSKQLGQLKFGRDDENEADRYSVIYLNKTIYACDGAAGFFIKAEAQGQSNVPTFLSTHPNPGSRIQNIQNKANELNCRNRTVSNANFEELKRIL